MPPNPLSYGCALLLLTACVEDIRFATEASGARTPATSVEARSTSCDGETTTCGNALFRYALCTCSDLKLPMPLQTDAYDSSSAPYAPGQQGASVATNGRFTSASGVDIAGSLIVGGARESIVFAGAQSRVTDNVRLNSELSVSTAQLAIARDLWVNGRILTLAGALRVERQIHQPAAAENAGEIQAGHGFRTELIQISPPCPCVDTDVFDYAAMAERFAANSDNAAHDLPRDALLGADELTLPCGRYLFDGGAASTQRWRTDGRAALFVDGDLELNAPLYVELGARGELDVFVRGSLILGASAEVVTQRPAALRLYVNGAEPIAVPASAPLSCSLYAPNAPLRTQTQQTLMGAFVVSELIAPVPLAIHYDAAGQGSCESSCAADGDCGAP